MRTRHGPAISRTAASQHGQGIVNDYKTRPCYQQDRSITASQHAQGIVNAYKTRPCYQQDRSINLLQFSVFFTVSIEID